MGVWNPQRFKDVNCNLQSEQNIFYMLFILHVPAFFLTDQMCVLQIMWHKHISDSTDLDLFCICLCLNEEHLMRCSLD